VSASVAERVMVEPAYLWRPPAARSLVTEVTRVCASVDRILDEEQQLAVSVATGLKPNGTPAALEAAIISARQNLKTYALEGIALTLLLDPHNRVRLGIWSAQEFDTAQETFRHFADLFESPATYPHLARRLKAIHRGSGKEEIELLGGRRLKFKARSGKGGRGLTGDFVVLDEAFALDAAHMGALLPTLSTRRRAMVFYGSSAAKSDSEILHGLVARGRRGGRGAPAYIEWCAPGSLAEPGCEIEGCHHSPNSPGCSLDRQEYWLQANPAMGRRITVDYLETERAALPPLEFARERLGWHEEPDAAGTPPISVAGWQKQLDPTSAITEDAPIVISVEIPLSRKSTAIGVAGWRDDGMVHVGLVDYLPGVDQALARILELAGKHKLHKIRRGPEPRSGKPDTRKLHPAIIIDPTSPAGMLVDPLRKAGFDPVLLTVAEVGASCAGLQDALTEHTVWHRGSALVDVAIEGAVRRDLGDGNWAFGRRKSAAVSVDVAPVVALTQARWGLTVAKKSYNLLDSFW
jgi:hypothetical protein